MIQINAPELTYD